MILTFAPYARKSYEELAAKHSSNFIAKKYGF